MRIAHTPVGVALILALVARAAAADPPGPSPGWPEEFGSALDEVAEQLRALGQRWRGYFWGSEPGERPIISIMLSHRLELGLTTAQVQELERLRADFQREAIRGDAELRVADMDLTSLLKADPAELGKVEAKIREIERVRADLRVARVRAIEQAKAQLTPDQRKKLAGLLAEPWTPYRRWRTLPPPPPPAPPSQ
jgi:Spy/CpxP family protein refolding chaperone